MATSRDRIMEMLGKLEGVSKDIVGKHRDELVGMILVTLATIWAIYRIFKLGVTLETEAKAGFWIGWQRGES